MQAILSLELRDAIFGFFQLLLYPDIEHSWGASFDKILYTRQ